MHRSDDEEKPYKENQISVSLQCELVWLIVNLGVIECEGLS